MTFKRGPGRPLKIKTLRTLKEKIDKYFLSMDLEKRPYTVTGLALALGTCRQTLLNYEENKEYLDTLREAKEKVQGYAEEQLFIGNSNGAKFSLNVNYGWTEEKKKVIAGDKGQPLKIDSNIEIANKIASLMEKADI